MNSFFKQTGIPLDPIYTGKMVYGVIDLIAKNYFPLSSKILMIHTGGLQGIEGMNIKLLKQNSPTLLKDV
jgi:1-aminocyclopropane-1-carboxylate deaminase